MSHINDQAAARIIGALGEGAPRAPAVQLTHRIEIHFGAGVRFPAGFERALDGLIGMVCKQYEEDHPERVMWPAGSGSKPLRAFFSGDPADGPSFDDAVYAIDCCEREDLHDTNPLNPKREALRKAAKEEAKARRRASKGDQL